MDIAKLPTDALYKCAAIGGLFLVAASATAFFLNKKSTDEAILEFESKRDFYLLDEDEALATLAVIRSGIKRVEKEMEEFENESREQQKLISSSHKTVNESPAEQNEQEERIDSSLEQLRKENDDLIKQALEYWDLYYRGKKSYVIAETARKGAVLKLQSAVWIRGFSIAGLFLGPLISGFGFFFWHTRIQKNQDLILGPIDIHFNQMSEAAR